MIRHARNLDLRAGEIEVGGNKKEPLQSGRQNFLGDGSLSQQGLIESFAFEILHPERTGSVTLGVKIDEQDALSLFRQRRTEVYCRRGFADTALLIRDRDDFQSEPDWHLFPGIVDWNAFHCFISESLASSTRRCDGHRLRATKDRRARVAFL